MKKLNIFRKIIFNATCRLCTSYIANFRYLRYHILVIGRDVPCPERISLDLRAIPLPAVHYARHLVSLSQFKAIIADLHRHQREIHYADSRHISIPEGKIFYMRKDLSSKDIGQTTRFLCRFDSPFLVTGYPNSRSDLPNLRPFPSDQPLPRPVKIKRAGQRSCLTQNAMICVYLKTH